jgi:ABC-2 type transport system permease protein
MSRSNDASAALRRTLNALPTMLRVGVAETVAYRAEFVVWMLTTTLPLIMLGLWTSVAREAPFAHYTSERFVAYYLATLIVRNLTGSWVVWQLNEEIRRGALSVRLLKPIHPFVALAASHLAAVPLRALIGVPFAIILLLSSARAMLTDSATTLVIFVVSLPGAWLLTFFTMLLIGSLGLFIDKSLAVFDVYLGLFAVLSGYLVPLELLPRWAHDLAHVLPFRYMLGFPVDLLCGGYATVGAALADLAVQWAFVALVVGAALAVWRVGLRRYEAFGA